MKKREPVARKRLLVIAQLLSLATLILGLQFLFSPTGGTVFLFATVGPLLVGAAVVIIAWVGLGMFLRRHSLFTFATYQPGEIVFRQGDEGDAAFFIRSGEVEVLREQAGKEAAVVARLTEGYFGEMALLSDAPRNATVRAVTTTTLAVLGKANFISMCAMMPTAHEDILHTAQQRAAEESERQ